MKVVVDKIKPHPLNGKIYALSNIDDLAASIEEQGLLRIGGLQYLSLKGEMVL